MKKIPKQAYTAEFKELAVKRVSDGQTIAAAAKELCLSGQTLRNWIKAAAAGKLSGAGGKVVTPEAMELSRLRSEVARLKRENEIIKNRPTRLGATLMNRNFRGVHLMRAETVAACFLEVSTPSKNLAQGKLRTHLWRRLRTTPFRKLIYSESPSCA
jgi:transposase